MWKSGDTWCVCDTYRAVRFKDKLPLEELSDKEIPIDIVRVFGCHTKNHTIFITLPNMADLKLYDKTHKSEPYLLDATIPVYVDVKFLISMMECLPNARVTTDGKSLSALYFEAENGDGILLPLRLPEKSD